MARIKRTRFQTTTASNTIVPVRCCKRRAHKGKNVDLAHARAEGKEEQGQDGSQANPFDPLQQLEAPNEALQKDESSWNSS